MTLHFMSQSLSYRGDGMKDDTKQKQEIKAKRTAKNSVFLENPNVWICREITTLF